MAIPILAGPGAIATVVLYMSQAGTNVLKIVSVLVALAVVGRRRQLERGSL